MRYYILGFLITCSSTVFSQNYVLPLWQNDIPNAKPSAEVEFADSSNIVRISHVQNPTIEVYLPSKRNTTGQSVVICPGGGYKYLAYDWEGTDIAKLLNAQGIAGIVLKYRLPDNDSNLEPHKSPLMDAQQAMKVVRMNASKWNLDPDKVGVMGFSAGGHLASTLGTHFDEDSRPNFMVLIYPVISMQEGITHMGSRNNLLGENPSQDLIDYYSNEKQVTANTPPTFLIHASDDKSVLVDNSLTFYKGLIKNGVAAEMHIYPNGGHGFGLGYEKGYTGSWTERLFDWLESMR
ncbi:alpha/beta hydrolase [Marinoscillum sp.]|uniref:alpha/beta hydrolase n=1 Tax=Marinoscillum sp. TaxID=2024838 RepID=UPI003BA934F1